MEDVKLCIPEYELYGTIPDLVKSANRYTDDYSTESLQKLSEVAKQHHSPEQYVQIPLLLITERENEEHTETLKAAYARLKIEYYLSGNISLSMSYFGAEGTELEIRDEGERVLISLEGADEAGTWSAAGAYDIETEFMTGEDGWLDNAIGQILFYAKQYYEQDESVATDLMGQKVEKGCRSCPYAGHCRSAYTENAKGCNLYNHEPLSTKEVSA